MLESIGAYFAAGRAGADESATDEVEGFFDEGERGGVVAATVFEDLGELDVGTDAAIAGLFEQGLPAACGVVVGAEASVAPGHALEEIGAGGATVGFFKGARVVLGGEAVVAGVFGCAGGLEGGPIAGAVGGESGGEGNEGEDVPGVVAEDGGDMRGVATALEGEVACRDFGRRTVVFAFETQEVDFDLGEAM